MTTLRQMRFLVALADTGNFSRAAKACNVTQSTLSTGLREMEARIGVQVAERTTHSVLMTPVGLQLTERARDILARVEDFEERARSETKAGATLLRLGAIPTIGPFLLPKALPMIRVSHPAMKVYLREELTEPLVSGLREGRFDLILFALPHELPDQFETEILFEDDYRLAAPRGHPLANLDPIDGPYMAGRELLLLEKGHCLHRHALGSVPGVILDADTTFSATSLPTLVSMVEEGMGVTLLPDLSTDAGLTNGHDLHLSRITGTTPRCVALAWRQSSANKDVFQEFGQTLRQVRASLAQRQT